MACGVRFGMKISKTSVILITLITKAGERSVYGWCERVGVMSKERGVVDGMTDRCNYQVIYIYEGDGFRKKVMCLVVLGMKDLTFFSELDSISLYSPLVQSLLNWK